MVFNLQTNRGNLDTIYLSSYKTETPISYMQNVQHNPILKDALFFLLIPLQFAAVAALCVQYEADFRPNMSIVVKALQPLLNARSGPGGETPTR